MSLKTCLATFASEYRQVYKNESSKPGVITLDDKCGFVRKRTRTDVAVVRYARFSPTNQPEKHYQSLLQQFLPHYNNQELKPPFICFEEFYDAGSISNCKSDIVSVKEVVDMNRSKFEI